jgi:TonB family protein
MEKSFTNWARLRLGLLSISVLFIFAILASGQDPDRKWTPLSSPKGDLTLAMSGSFSVQNESEIIRVFSDQNGATMELLVRPRVDPRDMLKFAGQEFDDSGTVQLKEFKIGKVSGRTRVRNADQYSISIYLAGKNFYQITASAESSKNPVLDQFLSSIRIDGQALMKQPGPSNTDAVRIDSLPTSTDVIQALNVPDAEKISVVYDSTTTLDAHNAGGAFSRTSLILRKPRPTYTDAARRANVQGDVVLFVQLRANGSVGNVIVRKRLSEGLLENSIQAAKRIKFIPAQRNGQPVDSYAALTYSFAIY